MKLRTKMSLCALLLGLSISGTATAEAIGIMADPEPGPICIIFPELCD